MLSQWLLLFLGGAVVSGLPQVLPPASGAPGCSKTATDKLLTVSTTNGAVTGHVAPDTGCVYEYLGVPYARPPVGDLRFAAPAPIDTKADYVAANFGFDCPLSPSKPVAYPDFTPQAQR